MTENVVETDIVIVGAGGCGLTAALAAAELGKKVVLLESAAEVGGSTAMSAGIIVAAGSQLQLANGEEGTAEELAADIGALAYRPNGNQRNGGENFGEIFAVTMALCRSSGRLIDWLVAQGVPLEHMPDYRYPGMSKAWMLSPPQRRGSVMTDALLKKVLEQPGKIDLRLGTRVTGLVKAGDVVEGVNASGPKSDSLLVRAGAVILAASGFGGNPEWVGRYIPELAGAAYYGGPNTDGDAIEWGQSLGAATDFMGAYQSHSSIAYPKMMLVTTYLINHGAIQVNEHGNRFGDETDTYAGHALAVQAQPGRAVVEIFDDRILQQTIRDYPRFNECLEAGIVRREESLDRLAAHFGLVKGNLEATVADYNKAAVGGDESQDEFGRTRFGQPLIAPFYGVRVTSALVQTLGGLRVDAWARVLRPDGTLLPGLYAGGGTAAGLAGERSEGYMAGTGLLTAFGMGWIAGQHAARG